MTTKVRLLCDVCGRHFYYNFFDKTEYQKAEREYFEHYKDEHHLNLDFVYNNNKNN